jgi:hypothetical protein
VDSVSSICEMVRVGPGATATRQTAWASPDSWKLRRGTPGV